jgi:LmbE family N-acetylglucosaminyl deacetylase
VPALLAFIPHPDDESYSFAGTIALAARAGWACFVQCASSGEGGKRYDGGRAGKDALASAREGELAASCRLLGASAPVFWRLPDGALNGRESQAQRVAAAIRAAGADLVLSLGADGAYGHPDHVGLYRWVRDGWESLGANRPPLLLATFPPGLFVPQWELCRDMMGNPPSPAADELGGTADYEVDIGAVREVKLMSIGAHRTQVPGGDPEALFPPGIVAALVDIERFTDASGEASPATRAVLASLAQPS